MSTIPSNNTPPPTLPIDLSPRSTAASVFDAASGPSFNDHLQGAYRPVTTSEHRDESPQRESTSEAPKSEVSKASDSGEKATTPTAIDEASRENEQLQAEAVDTDTPTDADSTKEDVESTVENKPAPEAKDKGDQEDSAEASDEETPIVVVATNPEVTLTQPAEAKPDQKPTAEVVTEKPQENPKQVVPNTGTQAGDEEPESNPKQPVVESSTTKADAPKQAKAEEAIAKVSEKVEQDASTPAKSTTAKQQPPQQVAQNAQAPAKTEVEADATPKETVPAENPTAPVAKDAKPVETPDIKQPQQRPPQDQTSKPAAPTTVATPQDATAKVSDQEDAEPEETSEPRKKAETKNANPLLSKTTAKAPVDGNSQGAGDSAAQQISAPAATQTSDTPVEAEAVEASTDENADQSTKRVEVGSDDSKSITKPGPKVGDITNDAAPRTTSDTTETKELARTDTSKQHPEVDRTRFVQRVARAFNTVGENGGTLRLRLSPPELGSLRIEIEVRGSTMTARIEAETSAARSVLLESLPALRDRLAEQNIKIERFDVELANQSTDDPSRQPTGQRDRQGEHSQFGNSPGGNRRENTNQTTESNSANTVQDDTQLNVVV